MASPRLALNSEERPHTVAAVDLGSNSFHMVVGRLAGESLQVLDRMREPVQLARSLGPDQRISTEGQERALACLERFGQRLRELASEHVRATATNTFRRARNAREFAARASKVLGHPIEVISVAEEARLIYSGVAHVHAASAGRRLVIDIGGGSTELIIGDGFEVVRAFGLYYGCVNFSERFFPDGEIKREYFRRADTAARVELRAIQSRLKSKGWQTCIGASGTITTVHEILRARGEDGGITYGALKRLRRELCDAGRASAATFADVKPDRASVLPGGLAILMAIFKALDIDTMQISSGALREGVLYDLVGRIRHDDIRDRTITRLARQYHVDQKQADQVEKTSHELVAQLRDSGWLDEPEADHTLAWAARLHEIGLAVSYAGYHRHGAYLVANSDMPGFSSDEQLALAALLGGQRRRLLRETFTELPSGMGDRMLRLCIVLRLAILLNRSRLEALTPRIVSKPNGTSLTLHFEAGWLAQHPLTVADLDQESVFLEAAGFQLAVREA